MGWVHIPRLPPHQQQTVRALKRVVTSSTDHTPLHGGPQRYTESCSEGRTGDSARWGRRGWVRGRCTPRPEAERGAGPTPPGSGRPTRPARQPRLTRSGALHGGGTTGPHVSAGGRGDGPEQRPRTAREAEAETRAGPGSGGRCAGSGRGDQACGGAEPPEPLSPQKVHAQAGRALATGRRSCPDAAAEPGFGLRAGVGDSGEWRPARGEEREPLGAQSPPSPCSGAAPAALAASVISRGPAFPVPRFEGVRLGPG